MAITNHERVGKALELLKSGLGPFVERDLKNAYQAKAQAEVAGFMGVDRLFGKRALQSWPEIMRLAREGTEVPAGPRQPYLL